MSRLIVVLLFNLCLFQFLLFLNEVVVITQCGLFGLKEIELLKLFLKQYIIVDLVVFLKNLNGFLNRFQILSGFVLDWLEYSLWCLFKLGLELYSIFDISK
jgi:hypothetical protein